MSQDSLYLKETLGLIESDPEVKSFIYQQVLDLNSYITNESMVMVVARDPQGIYKPATPQTQTEEQQATSDASSDEDDYRPTEDQSSKKYRIAVIIKDGDHSIEAEAFDNDIYVAIKEAKDILLARLVEIQEEIESPQDRLIAIQQASDNKIIH